MRGVEDVAGIESTATVPADGRATWHVASAVTWSSQVLVTGRSIPP